MVTPDDKMTVPIDRLVFWAARCVRRVATLMTQFRNQFDVPDVQAVARAEDELVHAYRTALRLRAAEVVRYCDRIGLRGCTAVIVRDNPFLIVMAIEWQLRRLQGGRK